MSNRILFIGLSAFLFISCAKTPPVGQVAPMVSFTSQTSRTLVFPDPVPRDPGNVTASVSPKLATLLEKRLGEAAQKSGATGISVSIWNPDGGRWTGQRGLADMARNIPVDAGSVFHAGSVGKVFTAVLIFQLIENGELSLETPLSRFYPDFPGADRIRMTHLLTHTSGIFSFNWEDLFRKLDQVFSPRDYINFAAEKGSLFEPGAMWSYSNTNYVILGEIAAEILGTDYAGAVRTRIIEPLGLKHTFVLTPENENSVLISGHHQGQIVNDQVNHAGPFGAGCIATTPQDLTDFFYGLLNGELIRHASVLEMAKRFYPMGTGRSFYGKGLMMLDVPDLGVMLCHEGRIAGFGAMVGYLPSQNVYLSVMVNDETNVDPIYYHLLKDLPWQGRSLTGMR